MLQHQTNTLFSYFTMASCAKFPLIFPHVVFSLPRWLSVGISYKAPSNMHDGNRW